MRSSSRLLLLLLGICFVSNRAWAKILSESMPIEVEVSTTARLPCKVENPEETVIQWYKGPENNPTELFMGTLRQLQDFRFNMNPSDYTLTINNVTKNDSGIYTCDLLDQDIDERIVYELKVIDAIPQGSSWLYLVIAFIIALLVVAAVAGAVVFIRKWKAQYQPANPSQVVFTRK